MINSIMLLLCTLYPISIYISIQEFYLKNQKVDNIFEFLISFYPFMFLIIIILHWAPIVFLKKYSKIKKAFEISVIGVFVIFLLLTELDNNVFKENKYILYYIISIILIIVLFLVIILLYQSFTLKYWVKDEYNKIMSIDYESNNFITSHRFTKISLPITIVISLFTYNEILLLISLLTINIFYKKELVEMSNYIKKIKNRKYNICFWIFYSACFFVLIISGENIGLFTKITLASLGFLPIYLIEHKQYLKSEYYR